MLPACSQSTRDRGWTHSPRGRARVRRREGGQGGGRRAGTQREGGWSAGGANATPGLVGLLQGFVFSSTPASLAPGPKGALVLSNSLVNGWMKECERGWGGGGQGAGRESRWLGEGGGAKWGRGGGHWRESRGGRRRVGRASLLVWNLASRRWRLRGPRQPSCPPAWPKPRGSPLAQAPGLSPAL